MIGYIKGNILSATADSVLIETGGIGYEILCSSSALHSLAGKKTGEVYTYLQVREDGVSLFGFSSPEEKNMFLKLITVSGVGPKLGISVLAGMDVSALALAIASSDVKTLSRVKGLGKKTAERIILELRESVAVNMTAESGSTAVESLVTDSDEDALVALMTLGFTRAESVRAVNKAKQGGATSLEDIIRDALKSM